MRAFVGAFVVRIQVGDTDGTLVVRGQVGNPDGTLVGVFVGAFVVRVQEGNADGALLGVLVGALLGGSGIYFKITGGFRPIEHWLAAKPSGTRIPDDPTIRRAKIATERNMIFLLIQTSLLCLSRQDSQSVLSWFYW
jgi:hypothetical protein